MLFRSTFYRVAIVLGQGVLVIIAGLVETGTGLEPALLRVEASPGYFSPLTLPTFEERQIDSSEPTFVFSTETLQTGTTPMEDDSLSVAQRIAMLSDAVRQANNRNGFTPQEVNPSNGQAVAVSVKPESPFTAWVRNTFGEKREAAESAVSNVVAVAIRLSHAPQEIGRAHV